MTKQRIVETNEGIQDQYSVEMYDTMQRRLRDRGWIETLDIIKSGIDHGTALEIGPGPGYLGLEWLARTEGTRLTGAELSANMIAMAAKNADDYDLGNRVRYVQGNAMELPFNDASFDAVFSNGSLHEWEEPERVFSEIRRVLKPGGLYFISDLRRDMNWIIKQILKIFAKPKVMRAGLISSIQAAYTPDEIERIVKESPLNAAKVSANMIGLEIAGSS